jgi:hypothetical protein
MNKVPCLDSTLAKISDIYVHASMESEHTCDNNRDQLERELYAYRRETLISCNEISWRSAHEALGSVVALAAVLGPHRYTWRKCANIQRLHFAILVSKT